MRRTYHAAAAVAICSGLFTTPAASAAGSVSARLPATPAGQVLVVQANLQDSVRQADARDTRDLDNFARRLAEKAPAAPDALLLTEVLGPGARHLAHALSRATGQRYRAEVAGERSAFLPDGAVRQNAIILNTRTMTAKPPRAAASNGCRTRTRPTWWPPGGTARCAYRWSPRTPAAIRRRPRPGSPIVSPARTASPCSAATSAPGAAPCPRRTRPSGASRRRSGRI
ncbi:hypothetical protein [Nonomuraea sp. K271]|uniref:hypothetical protein n=1 Tax=Nonomuraea sp. K271 TaxID=1848319 RepID=UPI001F2A131C|nr:hypothetical protein [Nonomuraea sp. K271]